MADQSPSKLSPTAGMFMPGAVQIPHTDENGELEFTRPEFMSQNHEISSVRGNYEDFHGANVVDYHGRDSYSDNYFVGDSQYDNGPYGTSYYPEYSNGGGSMFGDNGSNNYGSKGQGGDYKKTKGGYKNKKKDFKNKPQHNNHSATYYPGGEQSATYYPEGEQHAQYYTGGEQPYYVSEPIPYPCEQKRKALAEGMTAICVGCGAFGKKLQHGINGHNWASLSDTVDYSNFMSAPICPHGSAPKKHGGDRQMGKKFERSEGHVKKQPNHSNKANNASKHDDETQTVTANVSDRDNETQTSPTKENHETQTSPVKESRETQTSPPAEPKTKSKSRPNSLMISGWSATIPLQLQNVMENIPALHQDGSYNAHDRIKSTITMFEEFVKEYETVLEENKMLKSQVKGASPEPKEAEKLVCEMGVGEVKVKGEYLGYSIEK
ncbi:hypothetical protein BLS_005660 [Venturia inaequalis]|uniref:Uncharacterized protein n=1 Tax=Venturia inaequalis TaxID=5025 RepID=A0A8H3UTR5_VENIN|nr:hypothetical protein BLS_005660 [Venturia inaequalis]KAE9975156.1 hypothetical protein EG328_003440 [Venturia inaequalis]KAE9990158.1 hypothetical protein EG327_001798 [Venturia inaequalis]RDI89103.1 hypothetical protein Vi05172_g137 [Venturia inaequalis]